MKKRTTRKRMKAIHLVKMGRSHSLKWTPNGQCLERYDDDEWIRREDLDFGTPNGDLIIDPWIQDALKQHG